MFSLFPKISSKIRATKLPIEVKIRLKWVEYYNKTQNTFRPADTLEHPEQHSTNGITDTKGQKGCTIDQKRQKIKESPVSGMNISLIIDL